MGKIKRRAFSLYDMEQFLKDAGAEKVHEKAIISLERELQDTVNTLLDEAYVYANYAGRRCVINASDIALTAGKPMRSATRHRNARPHRRQVRHRRIQAPQPRIMVLDNIPVAVMPQEQLQAERMPQL